MPKKEAEPKITPRPKAKRTEKFWNILNMIEDPDVGYGIVDLGLIYDIIVDQDKVATVYMTLTSPTCPSAGFLIEQVEESLADYKDFKEIYVEIVWEPFWDKEMIDEDIRYMLFGE